MSSPSSQTQLVTESLSVAGHVCFERSTKYVDADGDLRLQVGSETGGGAQDFVVCSRTMGRSSPVWKRMLFGNYKESKPAEGEWVVSLPEDEPKALATVLNIIHGRFAEVPKSPSLEQLYGILALTHKYDMVQKVQPWATSWSVLVTSLAKKKKGGNPLLTFVAWELGQEEVFKYLIENLVLECYVDSKGRLVTEKGHCLDDFDHLGPNDLIARIYDARRTTIQYLLDLVDEVINRLSQGLQCTQHKPFPQNDADRLACDSLILGSFWKSTIRTRGKLFPSMANDITSSVGALAVEIFDAFGGIVCDERHKKCNPAQTLQKLVMDTVRSRQSAFTSNHLRRIKGRCDELGTAESESAQSAQGMNDKVGVVRATTNSRS